MQTSEDRSAGGVSALSCYALCTTPFSGGALLCAHLRQAGLGSPQACFEPEEFARAAARLGTSDFDLHVARLAAEARGAAPAFGFEIHWPHYAEHFRARDPRVCFPGLTVFTVRRRDRLPQALRWLVAEQEARGARPTFDGPRARALLARIFAEEHEFDALFRGAGMSSVPILYEDLLLMPAAEVRRMLRKLGLAVAFEDGALVPHDPDAARAALLAEWRTRYQAFEQAEQQRHPPAAAAGPSHAFQLVAHNLPARLPAEAQHGARITLRNTGTRAWRAHSLSRPGSYARGEVALVVREDGEWVATHKLPRGLVAPGEEVTLHFALRAPSLLGDHRLGFDLIEWDVAHFGVLGAEPAEVWVHVTRPSERPSAEVQRVAKRVNPWYFQPSGGVLEGAEGHIYPLFLARAKGCKVWDLEGKEYLDYTMANASALLGHGDERVLDAIRAAMADTAPLTQMAHPLEIEVARMLSEDFPCAEMVTFGKNGSDVCTVVARLARAYTGRQHILYRGFHGWQDFWAEQPGFHDGAMPPRPEPLMHPFRYNDRADFLRLFERHRHELAAVMIEPTAWAGDQIGYEIDEPEFLAFVAEHTRAAGALLIFDEIITGFRVPGGSVQKASGVIPDLACVAKALASGMPLAAALGRADVMKSCMPRIFYGGPTYRGEVYSLAAAKASIELYRREPVAAHVHDYGQRLKAGINRLCAELGVPGECAGPPYRLMFVFHDQDLERFRLQRTLYVQELLRAGILTNIGVMVPSYAHDEAALAFTLEVVGAALEKVAEARRRGDLEQQLEIPPVYF